MNLPREQYERTYVLLPQGCGPEWRAALAVVAARREWTVGSSADDAGIGDLDVRRVIAVNPDRWPGDLEAFFQQYYPGVECRAVRGDTPLRAALGAVRTDTPLDLHLSQRDARWSGVRLGEEALTIGEAGCFLTALTIALRHGGYDVLPDEVNLLLVLERLPFARALLDWVRIGESLGWEALKENVFSTQRLSDLLAAGWRVVVARKDFKHFFYALRGNPVQVIDPLDGKEKTLLPADCGGIRALRPPGAAPAPPATPPQQPVWHSRILTSLHVQARVPGWLTFLERARPRSVKIFSPADALEARRVWPEVQVVFRPYWNDFDQQRIIAENNVNMMVARVLGELAGYGGVEAFRGWLWVEGLNETFGTGTVPGDTRRIAALECAFAERMLERGLGAVILNVPVGNIEPAQARDLLAPAARLSSQTGRVALGYHAYWWANTTISGLVSWWKWHAGRALELWDPEFRRMGLSPLYYFGEIGAVGSADGNALDPLGGWRAPNCYGGDWGRYLADLLEFERRVRAWCAENGDRVLGAAVFTLNPGGWGWDNFLLGEAELLSLADALAGI